MSSENERSLRDELSANLEEVQERARDEAGRFARVEKDDVGLQAPMDQEIVKSAEVDVSTEAKASQDVTKPDEDPFPQTWKQDYKKHWSALPKEVKDYIRQHEADTRKSLTAQDEDRLLGKNYRGVHGVLQPYMPMIQAEGGTAETAIQALLNQAYVLRHGSPAQKRDMLLSAIKTYGIDITEPTSSQGWVDPQVSSLQQQLEELKGWRSQWEQSVQMQEKASIDGQIAAFGSDPKHTHFANPQVQTTMGHLLASGLASSMEEAYEKAVWSVADLRSTLLKEQSAQEEAKRVAEAKAKADAARKASGSVRGSSAGFATQSVSTPKGSLREELQAQFAASKNRI